MESSSPLAGQVVVITGSTRGIGRMMIDAIAAAGANVVVSSRSPDAVTATQKELAEAFPDSQVLGIPCDMSQLDQVEALAQQTVEKLEKIDVWFNNAAVTHPFGPTLDIPLDRWQAVINTNIYGTYYGTRVALKHMLPCNQGKIINMMGSGAVDGPADGYLSAYATSKAAVRRFTLVVADDYKKTGLTILGLNPGLVPTDLTKGTEPLNEDAQSRLKFLSIGLNLFPTQPETIRQMAVHIASDATDGKNGKMYRCRPSLKPLLNLKWTPYFKPE